MRENPVEKAKKVTAIHMDNVYKYLFKELQDVLPNQKILDICFAVSNEVVDTAIDVGDIYIAHEGWMIEEIRKALIEKLK